jgi:hypothetical protein
METEDGVRSILAGIDRKQRIVHFPWPLSYPMRYVVRNLPGLAYDWLMSKAAGGGKAAG